MRSDAAVTCPPGSKDDSGTTTAETAVTLPALALVLLLSLWSVSAVTAQLRCVDAARTAARALARGESAAASTAAATRAAPRGARILVVRSGELLEVRVTATARLPGPWSGSLPALGLTARAVTSVEDPPTGAAVAGP